MAVNAAALETYDDRTIREDLTNAENLISPTETPFMSMICSQGKATNTLHEWPLVALGAVNASNRSPEGEDAPTIKTPVYALRRSNYTQISIKVLKVTDTTQWVDGAANIEKMSKQIAYALSELKRDKETLLLQSVAALPGTGNGATTRTAAGLPSFWQTNVSRGVGGMNPVLSGTTNGYPSVATVDGTPRAITEDLFNTVVQAVWTSGGVPKYALVGPSQKRNISKLFNGYTTKYSDGASNKLINSVEIYQSDFGTMQIVPDRFGRDRDCHIIDPEFMEISVGQPTTQKDLARTGLTENKLIEGEYTLSVGNEASGGILADLS